MKFVIALIIEIQVFSLIVADSFDFNLNEFQVAVKRFNRAARVTCLQPPETRDKTYTVKLPNKEDVSQPAPGEIVDQFTIIVSRCNAGYAIDYQTDPSTEIPSVCISNSWQQPVLKCKRMCKNFAHFSHFNTTCYEYFGGPKVPCDGLLLERAIVIPRCQQKYHPNIKVNYDYATCREDGKWDKPFFKCVPDCGQVASKAIKLISGGRPETRGGSPWNVAIYSTEFDSDNPKFICGGTLINEELIISAAHCFYDEVFRQNSDTRFYHVIVGKATLDYKKVDYNTTKTYRLKNIFFPDTPFKGAVTNYASDIAILQLPEKISFSQDVLPACLHFDDKNRFDPGENEMGKLSGFGATANGSLAQILLTAQLPYISYGECLKRVREDFLGAISLDKFCAGSDEKGTGARQGDSGGGLVFLDEETGLFHLRGVVSNKDLSSSSHLATFTDIAQYISWISKIIEIIERNFECSCNPDGIKQNVCNAKSGPCQCKAFVTGRKCDTCKDSFFNLRADNPDGCSACGCNSMGSYSSICNKNSGSCQCKPNVIGRRCDDCTDSTKVLTSNGCEDGPKWLKYSNGETCPNAVAGGKTASNEILYIARHEVKESLLPGKLVPSEKLAFIPWGNAANPFSDYEVLCGGSTKWVAASNGVVPKEAVAGGIGNGKETIYICRATTSDGSMIPGKQPPSEKVCYIVDNGKEYYYRNYEILVKQGSTDCECNTVGTIYPYCEGASTTCKCKTNVIGKNCDKCAPNTYSFGQQGCKEGPKWLKHSNGEKCSNAVVGGKTKTNEIIYIARHGLPEALLPGNMIPSQQLAYIPWGNASHSYYDYEVLCGGSTKWVAATNGEIPAGAVPGGLGAGLKETIYICRANVYDGSVIPGKQVPSERVCNIVHKGKEYYYRKYELLVKDGSSEDPKWQKYKNGDKCSNAVVGGKTETNENMYIARHVFRDVLLPGKLVPSEQLAYVPWGNSSHPFSDYEVLCGGSTKWVETSNGVVPKDAIPGGKGSEVNEIIYICKGYSYDGSEIPGKQPSSEQFCYAVENGREYYYKKYDILVAD